MAGRRIWPHRDWSMGLAGIPKGWGKPVRLKAHPTV